LTSLVKHGVRAQAMDKRNSPAAVLRVVNKVLLESSRPEDFATVFFGVMDCDNGDLTYCNAGHTTTAILRTDGSVDRLPSNSQLVGALARASFHDSQAVLEVGDVMLMYTDGVIEARSGAEFFGEERLMRAIEEWRQYDPEELVSRVVSAVVTFAGGHLGDDVAILAVQRE